MLTYIIEIAASIFLLRTLLFIIGAKLERNKNRSISLPKELPFVSVIVPSRNEEANIASCIKSLAANSYPSEKFEIIAINDRSTDGTQQIIESMQASVLNLKIVNITDDSQKKNLRGKPGALQAGIDAAQGEIILMTDADCEVGQKWVETLAAGYTDPKTGLVASFTITDGKSIFEKIQTIEWITMNTIGSSTVAFNQPMGCYGNNLSVRKKFYNELGGYSKIKFSVTEDLALLREIIGHGWTARYYCDPGTMVTTNPIENLTDYIKQHHRWATGALCLGWRALVFVLCTACLWLAMLLSVIDGNYLMLAAVIVARMVGDFLLIYPSLRILNLRYLAVWVPLSVIFFILLEAVMPFTLFNKKVVWKGQVFSKK